MEFEASQITIANKPIKGIKIIGNKVTQRNAMHTIVLLDVSGSMNDNRKLENVKKSLGFLLKFLQSNDKLTLVTFNYLSEVHIQNMNITQEYLQTFQHIIQTLRAEGGTNLSAGLLNVKRILDVCASENASISKTGLIILTDGHTNEGVTSMNDLLRIVESIKSTQPSISITTIGYDDDHNAELLKSIAVNGGGSYNIVNNIEQVATVFGDILGGLVTTVVQNCYAKFNSSWRTLNIYPSEIKDNSTILKIGDINAESETILLFENTDNSVVEIGGITTTDFTTITTTINFVNLTSNLQSYYIAYIRFDLANILQNIKTLSKDEITNRLTPIKQYLNTQQHPLVSYLKQQITEIETQIINPQEINQNISQNIQASMCLAFGRGTSAFPRRVARRLNFVNENDLVDAMNNVNIMETPFANATQRLVSQSAVNYTQESADDPMES